MKLRNDFDEDAEVLFNNVWDCGECGCNGQNRGGLSVHHIYGRISNSPLNGIVLCGTCHSHVGHTQEEHLKYLKKTFDYALSVKDRVGWVPKERDREFIDKIKDDMSKLSYPQISLLTATIGV